MPKTREEKLAMLAELRANAETLCTSYNENYQDGKIKEAMGFARKTQPE